MRLSLAALGLVLGISSAYAEDIPLDYVPFPTASPEAQSLWVDFVPGLTGAGLAGGDATIYIAQAEFLGDTWTVSQIGDQGYCSANACSTRVFRNEDMMFSGEACTQLESHVLRPDALVFRACDESFDLSPIDQR